MEKTQEKYICTRRARGGDSWVSSASPRIVELEALLTMIFAAEQGIHVDQWDRL
jgi:hypothetical protein